MPWTKKGRIFAPDMFAWAGTHAQIPTVIVRDRDLRILYSARDADGRAFIRAITVDRDDPARILHAGPESVMGRGEPGTFDEDGVMSNCVVREGNRVLLYYNGWNRRVSVPYHNAIGLAVSDDGGETFQRLYRGPILDRTATEPFIAVTPWVLAPSPMTGNRWRMWYSSGMRWLNVDNKWESVYVIKHAHSADGRAWERPGDVCVPPQHEGEALASPTVLLDRGIFKMWYCFRGSVDFRTGPEAYRIGYAESSDGVRFTRMDDAGGLNRGSEDWDFQMQCYPHVVTVDGRRLLFYNGNAFGQAGFGYALWQPDAEGGAG